LVLVAEHDNYYDPRLADRFFGRLTAARSKTKRLFHASEGGDMHCENGAYYLPNDAIFGWLEARQEEEKQPRP
jgi:hypothetical protein